MGLTDKDIVIMNNYAIEASFADEKTKNELLQVQKIDNSI